VPGCSHAFDRAFVVYTDAAKIELLDVPPSFLPHGGAVSQPTAIAMAEGAIGGSKADVAVSITGWAEEVGDPERPGGLVHFACARRGGFTHHRQAPGRHRARAPADRMLAGGAEDAPTGGGALNIGHVRSGHEKAPPARPKALS
jgi:nicotinamide-nucleotide amidase